MIRGAATDDATHATALSVGKTLKKSCVLVKDTPAFVVNRLLTRLPGEVIAAVDEGTPLEVAEHALDPLGLPMSPFLLLQLVGPAVALHVAQTLHETFPDRFTISTKLRGLVESGKTTIYRPDLTIDPQVAELLSGGDRPSTADEVRQRALAGPAEEIRFLLDEGAVAVLASVNLISLAVSVEVMNALLLPVVLGFLLALEATALPPGQRMRGARRYTTWALCLAVIAFGLYLIPATLAL